ncbi:TonB-dependent receptor [Sphingomonas sp. BAUL-RG-20F-R05-02]|uniref:TonB-dependent receptor n=1 Tax=Sphingomonas sp. BAUL-RG-20F-R05-02 TaxID=2914830 RepID=UPI001F5668ED|nr:TonB-dependent receptor [Sphingomonas sp. BAUL-RG-20F-R05-02]
MAFLLAVTPAAPALAETAPSSPPVDSEIVVTASRVDLLGKANTASQGTITAKEVELRPVYRASQIFESIPGLVVTIHSGEGKAQQYLIRGYNLDHGTDFASFVDGMPVNRPTNTHGQGYSDLNFIIPQTVAGLDYTKGPYYAAIGDFGAVASAQTRIADETPAQATVTVGTDGYQQLVTGGTYHLGDDRRLLGAVELTHYDGPWQPTQNFRKTNALLRYSQGTAIDGMSLTAMFYQSAGRLITDQPLRAIEQGLIDRFGTLDPTDASRSLRYSLSAHLDKPIGAGALAVNLYGIHSTMTLWNNFTHYLDDPINGDQEEQNENRTTAGGALAYTITSTFAGVGFETVMGFQGRYDTVFVDRRHTVGRTTILPGCQLAREDGPTLTYPAVNGYCNADRAHLLDVAPYVQETVRWTPWLRTVAGVREEYYHATDRSIVTGTRGRGHQWLFQPKGSLILGPWAKTEFYVSAGRGFHSDDVRGVFGTVPEVGVPLSGGATPLLAQTSGYEIGVRSNIVPRLQVQLAAFQQDFTSELTYNADSGQDEAGAPSRRQGIEVSGQYHPFRWLELNTDLAFSKPRYHTDDLAAYGLNARYIADAPNFIYSAGVLVDYLGGWSGSLVWRRLGTHHLADGEAYPTDKGYSEWNLQIGYTLPRGWRVGVGVFNLFDSHDEAADYFYTSRLPGEPAEGITGFQVHPLEPRSARFSITKTL